MARLSSRQEQLVRTWELPSLILVTFALFTSIPITLGGLGLSSDSLNHHIYLGWVADAPRFSRDFLAASYQSYQFPYLYWPVYKLAVGGASGITAGVVLASIHLLMVPPVWMLARTCMPGGTAYDAAMRLLAVLLAFMTSVVLLLFETTSNDLLAAIPLVWAIAFAVAPLDSSRSPWMTPRVCVLISGLLAGAAVACKLSNGPLALLLPGLWLLTDRRGRPSCTRVFLGCAGVLVGLVVTYSYWGWQLWRLFGNPIYPMHDGLFAVLRQSAGWHP